MGIMGVFPYSLLCPANCRLRPHDIDVFAQFCVHLIRTLSEAVLVIQRLCI